MLNKKYSSYCSLLAVGIPMYNSLLVLQNVYLFVPYLEKQSNSWRWPCSNGCGRSYKNKQHLYRHMKNECGIEPRYKCEICLKYFTRKDHLKLHYALHHKIILPSKTKK